MKARLIKGFNYLGRLLKAGDDFDDDPGVIKGLIDQGYAQPQEEKEGEDMQSYYIIPAGEGPVDPGYGQGGGQPGHPSTGPGFPGQLPGQGGGWPGVPHPGQPLPGGGYPSTGPVRPGGPVDPGFGVPGGGGWQPGGGHPGQPLPGGGFGGRPVDPGYGIPGGQPGHPSQGPGFPGQLPGQGGGFPGRPVDPGFGRPGWSPVDPGYGQGGGFGPHPGQPLPGGGFPGFGGEPTNPIELPPGSSIPPGEIWPPAPTKPGTPPGVVAPPIVIPSDKVGILIFVPGIGTKWMIVDKGNLPSAKPEPPQVQPPQPMPAK